MDSFYTSAEEIEILAGAFNSKTLPKDRWTHAAHLTIAVWYLKKYLFHEALNLVRKGITEYNVAVGTQNTTTGGYHETMTIFWMTVTDFFIRKNDGQPTLNICNALLAGPFSGRELPFYFYEMHTILSTEARAVFTGPDKMKMTDEVFEKIYSNPNMLIIKKGG